MANSIVPLSSSSRLISNKDASLVSDGAKFLDLIVGQIAGPVRWDLCMEKMKEIGVTGIIELPPAGVLSGLVKRAAGEIETFALKSPEDLTEARAFVAKHSALVASTQIHGEER
jgi:[acyl-carrier-protein] S-malonyltransferase